MCLSVFLYHNASQKTHALATVGMRHHVSIADGEEGDGDEPHGSQEIAGHVLSVMVPEREKDRRTVRVREFYRDVGSRRTAFIWKHFLLRI